MDISGLRAEIEADPLGRGYAGMTDTQIAADLNTTYRSRIRPLAMPDLLIWAGQHNILLKLEQNKTNPDAAGVVAVALAFLGTGLGIDLNNAGTVGLLGTLVTTGVLSEEDRASLLALAVVSISRAQELGLSSAVDPMHVAEALGHEEAS